MFESKNGADSEMKSEPRGLTRRLIEKQSSPPSVISPETLPFYSKYNRYPHGTVLGQELRVSHPLDDVTKQEIERKKIKRQVDEALKKTDELRRAIAQITEHYAGSRKSGEPH